MRPARVRVLLGLGCRALGDEEAAAMELDAARSVFAQLGAAPDLARLERLAHGGRRRQGARADHARAAGAAAAGRPARPTRPSPADLVLAEKTVDRHVSNIFTKLGVSSRAAATAYAYQQGLL